MIKKLKKLSNGIVINVQQLTFMYQQVLYLIKSLKMKIIKLKMKNDSFMKRFKNLTIECLEIVGRSVLLGNWYY